MEPTTTQSEGSTTYQHYLEAETKQQTTLACLSELVALLKSNGAFSNEVSTIITTAENSLTSQQQPLQGLLDSNPSALRRTTNAARLAQKVFDIPELLEWILYSLDLRDLLGVQQINKQFFAAIQGSARIQQRVGWIGDPKSSFRFTLGHSMYPIHFYANLTSLFTQEHADELFLRMEILDSGQLPLPKLGSRARSVLICQPPISHFDVFTDCCSGAGVFITTHGNAGTAATVESKTGITIGHVIDMVARLREEHRLCPTAAPRKHDEDGYVSQHIVFETTLQPKTTDRFLEKRIKERTERVAYRDARQVLDARVVPYIAAKQAARDNGQPIPTLAEFEKATATESTS